MTQTIKQDAPLGLDKQEPAPILVWKWFARPKPGFRWNGRVVCFTSRDAAIAGGGKEDAHIYPFPEPLEVTLETVIRYCRALGGHLVKLIDEAGREVDRWEV